MDTTLAKFDAARRALAEARSIDEVKDVRDKAQALYLYAKQRDESHEMQNDIAEIKLRAERRLGELIPEMQERRELQSAGGDRKSLLQDERMIPRTLSDIGVSSIQSHRWQTEAKLPQEEFERYVANKRATGGELTSSGLLRHSRQWQAERRPPPEPIMGKYRIIYADPPWQYGNMMPSYTGEQADHYDLLTVTEIAAMPIKDIAEDNAVLFLWVTSPILAESFEVVGAWGFKYKAAFIWDKVKHNMGHYNSVRHELLLICTRGSCQPDERKLFDSVVSIERTKRHSVKPEEFRKMIDTLYTHGNRIELFARCKTEGWESYGNEIS